MSDQTRYCHSRDEYLTKMTKAFERHYRERTDMWSTDMSLVRASLRAIQLYEDNHVPHKPSVLDVGCGNGRLLEPLSSCISKYTGIDIFEHVNWQKISGNCVNFINRDLLECLKLGILEEYDIVFDNGCLHHQAKSDIPAFLLAYASMLSRRGILSAVVWAEPFVAGGIDSFGRLHHFFSVDQIVEMFKCAGLQVLECERLRSAAGVMQIHLIATGAWGPNSEFESKRRSDV
jgi:SAM-dependent methyltransferase